MKTEIVTTHFSVSHTLFYFFYKQRFHPHYDEASSETRLRIPQRGEGETFRAMKNKTTCDKPNRKELLLTTKILLFLLLTPKLASETEIVNPIIAMTFNMMKFNPCNGNTEVNASTK